MFHLTLLGLLDKKVGYTDIKENKSLFWHFLHNQKDDSVFIEVNDNLIPSIIEIRDENISNQFKLLEYFEKYCFKKYSDEIINILNQLKEAKYEPLKRKIAIISKNLQPKSNMEGLYNLLLSLISSDELIVKEFAIDAATNFVDRFSTEQLHILLEQSFTPNEEKDVTNDIGGGTKLIHNGKNLTDGIFRNASKLLGKLLQSPDKVDYFISFAMDKIDEAFAKEDVDGADDTIKYNSIWWFGDLHKSREFEYESDPEKKLSYELWNALNVLKHAAKPKFLEIARILVEQGKNLIYFEILNRVREKDINSMGDEDSMIMQLIVFNHDLWRVLDLDSPKWNKFFQLYFSIEPNFDRFEKEIFEYSIPDNEKIQDRIKAELILAIPEKDRSESTQKWFDDYEKNMSAEYDREYKLKVKEEGDDGTQFYSGRESHVDLTWIEEKRSTKFLINKLLEAKKDPAIYGWDFDDLSKAYWAYFANNIDDFIPFCKEFIDKQIITKGWFFSGLVGEYISFLKLKELKVEDFYTKLAELYLMIRYTQESGAKISIARILLEQEYLPSESTGKLSSEMFFMLKNFVIAISKDPDPVEENDKSFLNVGLNSVRGAGAKLLCILAFYYPEDQQLIDEIRKMSKDKSEGIVSYLITNLIYLIPDSKNYPLCKEIVNSFKENSSDDIDHAIILYMFRLGNEKLENNLDFLEKIINRNTDKDSLNEAGSLIGQAFLHQVNIQGLFDKILSHQAGKEELLESIAFAFQRTLWKQLLMKDEDVPYDFKEKMLEYFKMLLAYEEKDIKRGTVADRVSYLFADKDLPIQLFNLFKSKGVFDLIVTIKQFEVNHHLNHYLLECVKTPEYLEDILDILDAQIANMPPILSDDWYSIDIAKIVEYIYNHYDGENNPKAVRIFDEGLKYGTKGFYDIFDNWYREKIVE